MNETKIVKNIFSQTLFAWKKHGLAGAKQQEFASKNESDERALVTILILGLGVGDKESSRSSHFFCFGSLLTTKLQ